jgi:hypothetical protein
MFRSLRWSFVLLLIPAPAVGDPPKAPPEEPQKIRWKLRVFLIARAKAAPQLRYEVRELIVYRNGVWADYTVTNASSEQLYLALQSLGTPVRGMSGRDGADRAWRVGAFDGTRQFADPDEFVLVRPNGAVRFRALVTLHLDKLLVPSDPPPDKKPIPRPNELAYSIARWLTVYSRLPDPPGTYAFVTGQGKVPVKYFDEDAPRTLPARERLYPK